MRLADPQVVEQAHHVLAQHLHAVGAGRTAGGAMAARVIAHSMVAFTLHCDTAIMGFE